MAVPRTLAFALACLVSDTVCLCAFPAGLTGMWLRGRDAKSLTFSGSGVTGLGVTGSGVTLDSFTCHLQSGSVFVLRSSSMFTSGALTKYAYMCLELHQVNSNAYYVYERAAVNAGFGNERVVAMTSSTVVSSTSVICTLPASAVPFFSLIKEGSEAAAKEKCPDVLLGRYNYTYGASTCAGNSLLDVCTDKTSPFINRALCPPVMLGSLSGVLYCVGTVQAGSSTFVLLYNTDLPSDIDNFVVFRFTCVAVAAGTSVTRMSQNPNVCLPSMTPTSAPSSGGTFVMTHLELCPEPKNTTSTNPIDLIALAASLGGIFGGILVISLVAMAITAVAAAMAMLLGILTVFVIINVGLDPPRWATGTTATAAASYSFPVLLSPTYRPSAEPLIEIKPWPHPQPFKNYLSFHTQPTIRDGYVLHEASPPSVAERALGRNTLAPLPESVDHSKGRELSLDARTLPNSVPPEVFGYEYVMKPVTRNPYELF